MNILEAIDDPLLFASHFSGLSWAPWRAFLAALFGLGMSDADRAIYRQCTARTAMPDKAFGESCLVVGRRGGKSRILALVAVFLAVFRSYEQHLAAGETATIAVLAANRPQARSIFGYIRGLLKAIPLVAPMIIDENQEQLSNRVVIEVATASFRTSRGYSFAAVLDDEVAFWHSDESSANPDVEIMRALRPGMSTIPGSMLLMASSPYSRRGELYNSYRRHFGKDDARVLVWQADTTTMNPRVDTEIIREAYESDPEAARAEYGAEFRSDLADFVTREAIDLLTCWGRSELPPQPGVAYSGFCDPSGGLSDSMTLAVAHLDAGAVCVLDALLEIRPPFDPAVAVAECTAVCKRYGVTKITGDKYAGMWPVARFSECGISFEQSAAPKSDQYLNLLPLINSGRIELLDNSRLASQLCGLERRTARSGRDSVDHGPGSHDDAANAVAGVLTQLDLDRRPALVQQSAMLDAGQPIRVPGDVSTFLAVLCLDDKGSYAAVRAAKTFPLDQEGTRWLIILDFDTGPLHGGVTKELTDFTKFETRCRNGTLVVAPEGFSHGGFKDCRAIEIIDGRLPELQLLSAAMLVGEGRTKLGPLAWEKAKTLPFGAALNFRAGEDIDNPLRCAILTAIHVACDDMPDTRFVKVIG